MLWHNEGEAGNEQVLEAQGVFDGSGNPYATATGDAMITMAMEGGSQAGPLGPTVADPAESEPAFSMNPVAVSDDIKIEALPDGRTKVTAPGLGEVIVESEQEVALITKGMGSPGGVVDTPEGEEPSGMGDGSAVTQLEQELQEELFGQERITAGGIRLSDHGITSGRSRLLYDRDRVVNDGCIVISNVMRKFGGVARAEHIILKKIHADSVKDGHVVEGELDWKIRLQSPRYGSARDVTIPLIIRHGEFLEPDRLELQAGISIPFGKEAVTRLLETPVEAAPLGGMDTMPQTHKSWNPYS